MNLTEEQMHCAEVSVGKLINASPGTLMRWMSSNSEEVTMANLIIIPSIAIYSFLVNSV